MELLNIRHERLTIPSSRKRITQIMLLTAGDKNAVSPAAATGGQE